jgi:hypothetical protein
MLTKSEAVAHERKFWRLLAWEAFSILTLFGGAALLDENRLREFVIPVGAVLVIITWLRTVDYTFRDFRLRGANPLWAFAIGGPGFFAWLLWRRLHPIPTREDRVSRPEG